MQSSQVLETEDVHGLWDALDEQSVNSPRIIGEWCIKGGAVFMLGFE